MDDHIFRILEDIKDIAKGQGEIKGEIGQVRVRLEEIQRAQETYQTTNERDHKTIAATNERDHKAIIAMIKDYEQKRDKEIEAIWTEIGMLKGVHKEHDQKWHQVKGVKAVIWVGIPVLLIVFGKFIIQHLEKLMRIFLE